MRPNFAVALMTMAILVACGIYDAWASEWRDDTWTISYVFRGWAANWPLLPLAIGILIGHLFACGQTPTRADMRELNGSLPHTEERAAKDTR